MLFNINGRVATFVDPSQGIISFTLEELSAKLPETVRFIIPRRFQRRQINRLDGIGLRHY